MLLHCQKRKENQIKIKIKSGIIDIKNKIKIKY